MTASDSDRTSEVGPGFTIGWLGFHVEGLPALEAILASGYPLKAVITLADEERGRRSGGMDCGALCERFGVRVHKIKNINDQSSIQLLGSLNLDFLFVIGWSQIVKHDALNAVRLGMIGAHASMLPRNKGSAPINWALIGGEAETGNTLLWLDEHVDAGRIIDQTPITISEFDTCASLYGKVADSNKKMILDLIPKLLSGAKPGVPQQVVNEQILPRRRPSDGLIAWERTAAQVYNFIRALTRPYPGAFTFLDGKRWMVWQAARLPFAGLLTSQTGKIIGPVVSPVEGACGLLVGCGEGAVLLLEIENEDGDLITGKNLAGLPWPGKVFSNA